MPESNFFRGGANVLPVLLPPPPPLTLPLWAYDIIVTRLYIAYRVGQ